MLPKKNRADTKLVKKIFKEGKFINSPNLTLKYLDNISNEKRISFIVPKTVSKKAIVRNLLRRRGYFILKKYWEFFPSTIGGVFIFSKKSFQIFGGKKNKNKNPTKKLEEEIKIILGKLKN